MDEDEAFCSSPLYPSQMVVHTLIGDKILDFQALSEVWKVRRTIDLLNRGRYQPDRINLLAGCGSAGALSGLVPR